MSLLITGLVISKLAEQTPGGKGKGDKFIPYRDSTLTWLLKDNLGGNAKTVMMATISPAADNYEETLSTLRYADRAKRIVNHAVINEDPNAKIIRDLRSEVENLKALLLQAAQPEKVKEKLNENEKLMEEYSLTWDEKLQKTGQMQEDRRMALEKMGISVESSGIKVDKEKYFLVNLNADPSLNELLVYYIHGSCLVGKGGDEINPDILLSGLGIQSEHCRLDISHDDIFIEPFPAAKTCVNGKEINARTALRNGDRILWGSNHFFRINCPRKNTDQQQTEYDWRMAQEEVLMSETESKPMKDVIARLEKQYEKEKKKALESQKKDFERQFQQMKLSITSPTMTGSTPTLTINPKLQSKAKSYRRNQSTEESTHQQFLELRESIIKANVLVREANLLAEELERNVHYSVSLQVPAQCLTPNRRQGSLVTEPTIVSKQPRKPNRIMSLDLFENQLIDMRDNYQNQGQNDTEKEEDSNHDNYELIGVANIFLEVLYYDVKLIYAAPIISQHGKIVGKIHFDIEKISGNFPKDRDADAYDSDQEKDSAEDDDRSRNRIIQYRVRIHEASGISPVYANDVYCSYHPWDSPEMVTIKSVYTGLSLENVNKNQVTSSIIFNHSQEFQAEISEDFMEHCLSGAISIEVYGLRNETDSHSKNLDTAIAVKWKELSKKLSVTVSIQELNDNGEYNNVKVADENDGTGGTFQLRQGQQRRVSVMVKPISRSGGLPFACENVVNLEIGSIVVRKKDQRPLDSYQEIDLDLLREKWTDALDRRKEYLNSQIKSCTDTVNKNSADHDREKSLIRQWIYLAEERNAVLAPAEDSGVPGAPSSRHIGPGIEAHIPTLFLDLSPDDLANTDMMSTSSGLLGWDSVIAKEEADTFMSLPMLKIISQETGVGCVASWDSSLHESLHLNKVTDPNERCYLVIRCIVRLTHPVSLDLVLRKRICFNVRKRESFTEQLKNKLIGTGHHRESAGVIYDIVSSLPRSSEKLEDEESLALLAASGDTDLTKDGDTNIEKYSRQVAAAVDEILKFEKIRQNVAFKNCLSTNDGSVTMSPNRMQKTLSVPNMRQSMSTSLSAESLQRLRHSQTLNDFGSDIVDGRRSSTPTQDALKRKVTPSKTMVTLQEDKEMSLSQYQSFMSSGYETQSHNLSNSTISSQSSIDQD